MVFIGSMGRNVERRYLKKAVGQSTISNGADHAEWPKSLFASSPNLPRPQTCLVPKLRLGTYTFETPFPV